MNVSICARCDAIVGAGFIPLKSAKVTLRGRTGTVASVRTSALGGSAEKILGLAICAEHVIVDRKMLSATWVVILLVNVSLSPELRS